MVLALSLFDENLQIIEAIESFPNHVKRDNDFLRIRQPSLSQERKHNITTPPPLPP